MPVSAPRPCRHGGCGVLVRDGSSLCAAHKGDERIGKWNDPRRGSRHERGYGSAWEALRKLILRRDRGLCQLCMQQQPPKYRPAKQVDHIIPKEEGGGDEESNLQSLCVPCHQRKTAEEAQRGRARAR